MRSLAGVFASDLFLSSNLALNIRGTLLKLARLVLALAAIAMLTHPLHAQATFVFGKATLPANGAGTSLAQGDFNGDGAADFVWANPSTNTVSIILSAPNGTYAPKVDYVAAAASSLVGAIALADFNNDGKLDLAVANNDGTVSFLYGNGDGTFQPRVSQAIPPVGQASGLAVGDFNRDGNVDLVVCSSLGTYVYLGDGKGNFALDANAPTGVLSINAAVADFNNDGFLDIMIGDLASKGVMWLGDGKGGFQTAPNSPGAIPGAIADFNRDGILDDIYTVKQCGHGGCHYYLYEYFGKGDGTFTEQSISIPVFGIALAADFNQDRKMDLLLTPGGILLGNGDGTFQAPLPVPQSNPTMAVVGDFNHDGQLDFAALDTGGFLLVALGNLGNFPFPTTNTLATSTTPAHAMFGDFNNDGKLDQLTVDGSLQVQFGNGDGTFQAPISSPVASTGIGGVVLGDFNKDGNLDVAVLTNQTSITEFYLYLGNGNGTFQTGVPIPAANRWPLSAVVGDFNGDGNLDIAVSAQNGDGIDVFLGNGNGTFQTATTYPTCFAGFTGGTVSADFNGEGKLDLAVVCEDSQGGMNVLLGNGDGTFKPAVAYHAGTYNDTSIAVGDFNADGKLDIAISSFSGVTTYFGNGDGTFQAGIVVSACPATWIVASDFNLDGKTDLGCVSDNNNSTQMGLLLSNGDGTYLPSFLAVPRSNDPGPTVVDLDGNGAPDLISSLPSASSLTTYYMPALPVAFFSPGQLTFPYQVVGTTSTPLALTLANPGAAPLHLGTATATGDFAISNNGCPAALSVNAACVIDVTFTPQVLGLRTGTLSVASNNVGGTAVIPLSGLGESSGGEIQLSASSLTFGPQQVGTTSSSQNVTVTNNGAAGVTFTSIVANGDFIQTNNCPQTLAANGGSCTLTISFKPTQGGTRTGSVVLTDTAGTQTVALSGTGTAPAVTLNPTSLTFAPQLIKKPSPAQIVTLTNSGTAALTISSIAINGANAADYSETNNCGTSLAVNAACSINVVFKPSGINTRTASLTITDNAGGSPQTVSLNGIGTQVKISPAVLKWGKVKVNSSSNKNVIFSNVGASAVNISDISIVGANAGDFAETNTCGSSVAAKSLCTITVTFTPSATGKRSATLQITDNGGASPQSVPLTGTGK
jgi:hypothetical protein